MTNEYWMSETVDHGTVDAKGRKVGGFAVVTLVETLSVGYPRNAVGKFELGIYSTRNGKKFGAIPRGTFYATRAEAIAAAPAKLAEQGRRAAKAARK